MRKKMIKKCRLLGTLYIMTFFCRFIARNSLTLNGEIFNLIREKISWHLKSISILIARLICARLLIFKSRNHNSCRATLSLSLICQTFWKYRIEISGKSEKRVFFFISDSVVRGHAPILVGCLSRRNVN